MWLIVLSDQLWIVALVGHYPANKLIHRGLILDRRPKLPFPSANKADGLSGINPGFPGLSQYRGQITHVLLTRSPLSPGPKARFSLDLHVLSAPPAFVLSQDQTLREELVAGTRSRRRLADKLLSSLELELKCLSARPHDPTRGWRQLRYGIDGKTVMSTSGL